MCEEVLVALLWSLQLEGNTGLQTEHMFFALCEWNEVVNAGSSLKQRLLNRILEA